MKQNIEDITKQLEQGVAEVFSGDRYKAYLDFMGKFHDYSINNTILIFMQYPAASMVAGYQAWKTKFNRQVRKGEKAIKIMAPVPHRYTKKETAEDGSVTEKKIEYTTYRAVNVFDISQTDGDAVPEIVSTLSGQVEDYDNLLGRLVSLAPVPVVFEDIPNKAHGYFSDCDQRIGVQAGLPEQQTIKTLVHEISHAKLHSKDGEESEATRREKEVQAESVAYIVCQHLGIDASDYSFGYIAGWSGGREVKELLTSMDIIRKTAAEIIAELGEK